jgi:hypothetical protein
VYGVQTRPHKLIALNITVYKQKDLFIIYFIYTSPNQRGIKEALLAGYFVT